MSATPMLTQLYSYVPALLTPIHPRFPIAPLDLFGAMRLSSVVNWMATGAFDPPPAASSKGSGEKGQGSKKKVIKERATLLQECLGILIVVFGGETFLAICSNTLPSWLLSLKIPLLFAGVHALQTRTPLLQFLPTRPTLLLELALSLPDAIGRALLLTRFSVLPLLHSPSPSLPPTAASLLLVPFILAVPFPALIFTGTSWFSPRPTLSTPAELKPWGWTAIDAWLPLALPALFLCLIGPVSGWEYGLGWGEEEAIVVCMGVTAVLFAGRAVYNFGS